jgi:hypothetical protein
MKYEIPAQLPTLLLEFCEKYARGRARVMGSYSGLRLADLYERCPSSHCHDKVDAIRLESNKP